MYKNLIYEKIMICFIVFQFACLGFCMNSFTIPTRAIMSSVVAIMAYTIDPTIALYGLCCTFNDAHLVYNTCSNTHRIRYTCNNMHRLYYYRVKTHYIVTKWVVESPFLTSKSNVFFNKNI